MCEQAGLTASAKATAVRRSLSEGGRPASTRSLGAGFLQPCREPRLVAARRVAVNDALGGHLVHQRHGLAERRFRSRDILRVERRPDGLERRAELGPQRPVVLAALDVLSICFSADLVRLATFLASSRS